MKLLINGETKNLREGISLPDLLKECNVESPEMVSVQINQQFIDKADYTETILKNSDEVDFLYFLGGGMK